MVLWYRATHQYQDHDFSVVSRAFLNRYPNPFASHVLSIDLIDLKITPEGNLLQTKLICKKGRLPQFLTPFLPSINQTWIIEKTEIDPKNKTLMAYTRNLDHTKIIRIEEYTKFKYNADNLMCSKSVVSFTSGFARSTIKDRIENWSHKKFGENFASSRQGLKFVMDSFKQQSASAATISAAATP